MSQVYRGYNEHSSPTKLEQFILDEAQRGVSASTINHALTVINTIGNAASKRWRDSGGKTLIANWSPIQKISNKEAR